MFKILAANEMIKINSQIDLAQAFLTCKMVYVNRSLFFYWGPMVTNRLPYHNNKYRVIE